MKTIEMEIAVMKWLRYLQTIVVPNVSWGIIINKTPLHECDILRLSNSRYATEVEIKISKEDLIKDKKKIHGHYHTGIKYFYFAVPEWLVDFALEEIPERAGLLSVNKKLRVTEVRKPKINKNAIQWTKENELKLAKLGAIRIVNLKQKISKTNKKLKNDD